MRVEGATALVTGGASGLGLATARALRDAGAEVVVVDLPGGEERLDGEVGLRYSGADVRDAERIEAVVAEVASGGELRVLVNCAGIGLPGRTVGRKGPMPLDQFQQTIDVNLVGTFNMIRLVAAAMQENEVREGERGVVVNTASAAAFEGQVGQASYAASKGGIVGLTLPVARDLAQVLIRCVTIAPGLFDTPLFSTLGDAERIELTAAVPHPRRLGEPEEYAALVLHAIDNAMLNGEVIRLDGALRMAPR
jgi:NAD(P)-dependent dehydrogenase (short-subunit alcohol dehydrogenase family)